MLPNKLKNTASEKSKMVFFAYGVPYALLASFLSAIIYLVFSVEIIEKEILASNAFVATNAKKCPNRYLRSGRFFKLVEVPPQSPENTKCVLITQPSGLRLRDSLNR